MRRLARNGSQPAMACLGLAAAGFAVTLALHRPAAVVGALSVALAAFAAALQWLAFQDGRDRQRTEADVLSILRAQAVSRAGELGTRGVTDPAPLPVSWQPAPDLAESWDTWPDPAGPGPGPDSGDQDGQVKDPGRPVGAYDGLPRLVELARSRRLVILGAPGAGKTVLLTRLLDSLAQCTEPGARVPVFLPMASWDPAGQEYADWVADQMIRQVPALSRPCVPGGQDWAHELLARQRVIACLDGLDELPPRVQRLAIDKVNASLRDGDCFVMTSRRDDFCQATKPSGVRAPRVRLADVILLQDLDPAAIRRHILRDIGPGQQARRWDSVLDAIAESPRRLPAARALARPLMLSLASAIYIPRTGEGEESAPDPGELCDPERFPEPSDVEDHLLAQYIPAAYRRHAGRAGAPRWTAEQARKFLSYLAARHCSGSGEISLWKLGSRTPPTCGLRYSLTGAEFGMASAIAAVIGLVFGLAVSARAGIGGGLGSGVVFAFGAGIRLTLTDPQAAWSPRTVRARDRGTFLALAFLAGPLTGLLVSFIIWVTVRPVPVTGPAAGLVTGVLTGPAAFVAFSWIFGLRAGLAFGLVTGACDGLLSWLLGGQLGGLPAQVISGLVMGMLAGLLYATRKIPWGMFTAARIWLALRRKLPWQLMLFMEDAHQRGVLRQVGGTFQFCHPELRRVLAKREATASSPSRTQALSIIHRVISRTLRASKARAISRQRSWKTPGGPVTQLSRTKPAHRRSAPGRPTRR